MKRYLIFALVLFLSSCFSLSPPWRDDDGEEDHGLDDDDMTPDDGDDDDGDPADIKDTSPVHGDTDAYYRCNVIVDFTNEAIDPQITLVDEDTYDSIQGQSWQNANGTRLTFDPYGDSTTGTLRPNTSYTATISWSGRAPVDLEFTTSEVGGDVPEPEYGLAGRTFSLDLSTMRFTEPQGIDNLLMQYASQLYLYLHVLGADEDAETIDMFAFAVGLDGDEGTQDPCQPTVSLTRNGGDLFLNPYFRVGPAQEDDILEDLDNATFPMLLVFMHDLTLDGSFSPDGERIAGGAFSGVMDTRPLDELIDPGAEDGAACELLASLGIQCQDCDDGSGTFCLYMEAQDISGEAMTVRSSDPETGDTIDAPYEITMDMLEDWTAAGFCGEE